MQLSGWREREIARRYPEARADLLTKIKEPS
jgi:hypothetical protein